MRTHLTPTALLLAGVLTLTGCGALGGGDEETAETPAVTPGANARVIDVLDGNTLTVDRDGEEVTVHLLNLNVPSIDSENPDESCLAQEATDHLGKLLPVGAPVTLDYDEELGDGTVEKITAEPSESSEKVVARAAVTNHNGKIINVEMAKKGFGTATDAGSRLLFDRVQAASREADQQQNGIFARDRDCTLPTQLQTATQALLDAEGTGLKEPLEEAEKLAEKVTGYAEGDGGEMLQGIAQTQSVTTQAEALARTAQSKRDAYKLAQELEKEKKASQSPSPGDSQHPSASAEPSPESVNPDITDYPGDEIPEPPEN